MARDFCAPRHARPSHPATASRRLRRRQRVARHLACVAGATGFLALYALSWVILLSP